MNLPLSHQAVEEFRQMAERALLAREPVFPEKNYAQGILDAVQYLLGEEENPFERKEENF